MKKFVVAPSILTADFLNLKQELELLKAANIEWIHYDVMDNNFVPNLSFGPKILSDITSNFDFKIDVHLMVKIVNQTVAAYLTPFLQTNVKQITLHIEALSPEQIEDFIAFCTTKQIACSLALSPDTPVSSLLPYLSKLQNVLVMTVYPGFGGQSYLPEAGLKIKTLKELKQQNQWTYSIEVDGGINDATYQTVQQLGVEMIVAGSYLVGQTKTVLCERVAKLEN